MPDEMPNPKDAHGGDARRLRAWERVRRLARMLLATLGVLIAADTAGAVKPIKPVIAALPPAEYFQKAVENWSAGNREDATFWLYVAQLRWRARLTAHPDLDPTGEPALFASLMETVGRPINEYAFGDIEDATRIIDRALQWDAENPDTSLPEAIRASTRAGLVALRDDMRRNADDIRRQRTENGLENR